MAPEGRPSARCGAPLERSQTNMCIPMEPVAASKGIDRQCPHEQNINRVPQDIPAMAPTPED